MSKSEALVKNTLIIAIGKLSTQFLTFLLLPLYTAFLSPEAYGQLDLAIVYLGLLAPTLTVQMEMAVFRHLIDARKKESEKSGIISSAFAVAIAGVAVGAVLMATVGIIFSIALMPFIIGAFASAVFVNFFLQVARGIGRNDTYAIGSVLTGLTNIALSVIALTVLGASVEGLLVALTIANIAGTLYLLVKTGSLSYVRYGSVDRGIVRSLVSYAWPLVPNHISLWGINGISRTIVAIVLGLAATGIYAAASKFTLIYTSLYGIFAMSWTESVSLHLNKKGSFLSNTTNSTVKLFGSLSLLIISASTVVFPLLVSSDFADARYYIPLLITGGFFASLVTHYGAIYVAAKETKKIAVVTLQAVAISTVLTLAGIGFIGLYAPAIAILVTYLYIAIRRHFDIQRLVQIQYSSRTIAPLLIVALMVLIFYYIDNAILNIVSLFVSTMAVVVINKNDIHKIKNTILKKGRT